MVTLIEVLTPIVYLMGARGTFGFLKHKNYARVLTYADKCEHGYHELHKDDPCHPIRTDKSQTQVIRTVYAFIWFAWMPAVFLYKVVTARW